MPLPASLLRPLLAASLGAMVAACSPTIDSRGNLPTAERLSQVKPGKQTRGQIAELLGTPSSTSPFGEDVWYYISARTERFAFFAPETTERKVVAVKFDGRGTVSAVETLGLEDGRAIQMVERETPTAGKDLSMLRQLLGNVGRFSGDMPTRR